MKIFSAQLKGTTTVATGSNVSLTGSFSGSIAGIDINGTNTFTGSTSNRLNSIETISASNISRINSLETISASNVARLNSLEATSASVITLNSTQNDRLNSLETTSASVNTLNTFQSNRLNSLEDKTGSLATTGSNTFYGTQVFTGSVYITQNLIVQGSSSLQNITGSSVNIGTNTVVLNTANPAVRYGGISIIDSGSTGLTGSILWDSTNNNWLYQNPSGSSYTSAKFISGPQSATLGNEPNLINNYIVKAVGDDHISSSAIYDDGSTISLKSNTEISGTFKHNASTASFAGVVGIGLTNPSYSFDVIGTTHVSKSYADTSNLQIIAEGNIAGINLRSSQGGRFSIVEGYISANVTSFLTSTGTSNPSVEAIRISNSDGATIFANNITINSGNEMRFYRADNGIYTRLYDAGALGANGFVLDNTNAEGFHFKNNGTTIMRMPSSGYVGIGITNPSTTFNVGHSAHGVGISYLGSSTLPSISGLFTSDGTAGGQTGYGSLLIKARTDYGGFYSLNFFTATSDNTPVERMRITSAGTVGIGTNGPTATLSVYGNAADVDLDIKNIYSGGSSNFYLRAQTDGGASIRFARNSDGAQMGRIYYDFTAGSMAFRATGSDNRLVIASGGVGIGNSAPQAKLDLGGAYGGNYRNSFFFYNDNNGGPYYGTKNGFYMDQFSLSNNTTLSFSTAAGAPGTLYLASKNTDVSDSTSLTPRVVIAGQTGNVGIGITNSSHKLQIQGNLNLSGTGLMRTYFAQSYSLGSQFDIFRFLNDNGSVFAQGGISGLLFLSAQDTNTGGNQICYTFHLQTNGNGTAQANITQMSYQLRGTQPIQSIGLQNDGSGGAVKVVGSVVGSGVGGCNVWATFVGVAV